MEKWMGKDMDLQWGHMGFRWKLLIEIAKENASETITEGCLSFLYKIRKM